MTTNSKKITDLEPMLDPADNIYFAVANSNNTNNKLSFGIIKDKIIESVGSSNIYKTYPPQSTASESMALGAQVGYKIYQSIGGKLSINGSSTNVTTPIYFKGLTTIDTPSGDNSKQVVNVEYVNRKCGGLFGDFATREFIYGSELYTIAGPLVFDKTDPENWKVNKAIKVSDRTNITGWQDFGKNATVDLLDGKKISNYKKMIIFLADESGSETKDDDVQIYPFEVDCQFYIYMCQLEKERIKKFDSVKSASSSNNVTVNICGQNITYSKNLCHKNTGNGIYISPNVYMVQNATNKSERGLRLKYTDNYDTTLTALQDNNYIVSVLGLR